MNKDDLDRIAYEKLKKERDQKQKISDFKKNLKKVKVLLKKIERIKLEEQEEILYHEKLKKFEEADKELIYKNSKNLRIFIFLSFLTIFLILPIFFGFLFLGKIIMFLSSLLFISFLLFAFLTKNSVWIFFAKPFLITFFIGGSYTIIGFFLNLFKSIY